MRDYVKEEWSSLAMPNIKSAKKRLRQSREQYEKNRTLRSRVKTFRRRFMEASAGNDGEASQSAYRSYCSVLDKAAKYGIIKKNTAIRRKIRASHKIMLNG